MLLALYRSSLAFSAIKWHISGDQRPSGKNPKLHIWPMNDDAQAAVEESQIHPYQTTAHPSGEKVIIVRDMKQDAINTNLYDFHQIQHTNMDWSEQISLGVRLVI
jgi:hypothetical protein